MPIDIIHFPFMSSDIRVRVSCVEVVDVRREKKRRKKKGKIAQAIRHEILLALLVGQLPDQADAENHDEEADRDDDQ